MSHREYVRILTKQHNRGPRNAVPITTGDETMNRDEIESVYKVIGSDTEGWTYLPHDYDDSFEAWADDFPTRQDAYDAAAVELAASGGQIATN